MNLFREYNATWLKTLHVLTNAFFVADITSSINKIYPKNILVSPETITYFKMLPSDIQNDCKNKYYTSKWTLSLAHIVIVCSRTSLPTDKLPVINLFLSLMSQSINYQTQFDELRETNLHLEKENLRLIEIENTLSSILYHAPIIAYSKRSDGTYIHVNKMFEDSFGYLDININARTDTDYFDKETQITIQQRDREVLNGVSYQREETVPSPEGLKTYWSIKFPLRDAVDSIFAVAGVAFDITTKKKEEQERLVLTSEIQASKLIEQFRKNLLMTFSHEIKTPLNAIMLSTNNLTVHNELQMENVNLIQQQTSLLTSIVNDVINYERIQNNEKLAVTVDEWSLVQLEKIILNTWQSRIASDLVKITVQYKQNVHLRNDYNHTLQILNHLISNSVKFTQRGNIYITLQMRDAMLVVKIEDDGVGINLEKVERTIRGNAIVDFSTMEHGGMGFGLYLVSYYIRQMNGTFTISNRKDGTGTVAVIKLPVEVVEQVEKPVDVQKAFDGFRALSVDDNHINLAVLRKTLERSGITVVDCQSGEQAIEVITLDKNFDIVFMDWQMPGIDGIETTQKLQESGYNGPVVLVSAHILLEDREMLFKKGFFDVLDKPLTPKKINKICKWVKTGTCTPLAPKRELTC